MFASKNPIGRMGKRNAEVLTGVNGQILRWAREGNKLICGESRHCVVPRRLCFQTSGKHDTSSKH